MSISLIFSINTHTLLLHLISHWL